jgi:acetoacetyl-CoA synthetase
MRPVLWQVEAQAAARSNLGRFFGGFASAAEALSWAETDREGFWEAAWRFCGVQFSVQPRAVREKEEWFPGARVNYTANILRYRDETPALVVHDPHGRRRVLSFRELAAEVSRFEQALAAAGVGRGDVVAVCLPNVAEALITLLAAASLGAVFAGASTRLGVEALLKRFKMAQPRVVVGVDTLPLLEEFNDSVTSVRQTIVVTLEDLHPDLKTIPHCLRWRDATAFYSPRALRLEPLEFAHPACLGFDRASAACRAHGAGALLLRHLADAVLHHDIRPTDRVLCAAPVGTMSWYWSAAALATGATIILADPLWERSLWDLAAVEQARVLALHPADLSLPHEGLDLGIVRVVLTGVNPVDDGLIAGLCARLPDMRPGLGVGDPLNLACDALGHPLAPVVRGAPPPPLLGGRFS